MMDTNEKQNPWWFEIILGIILVGLGIWQTTYIWSNRTLMPSESFKTVSDYHVGPVILAIGIGLMREGVIHYKDHQRK